MNKYVRYESYREWSQWKDNEHMVQRTKKYAESNTVEVLEILARVGVKFQKISRISRFNFENKLSQDYERTGNVLKNLKAINLEIV